MYVCIYIYIAFKAIRPGGANFQAPVQHTMYVCVMCAMREDDISPQWRNASEDVNSYSRSSAHGHQPKGGLFCADGT